MILLLGFNEFFGHAVFFYLTYLDLHVVVHVDVHVIVVSIHRHHIMVEEFIQAGSDTWYITAVHVLASYVV